MEYSRARAPAPHNHMKREYPEAPIVGVGAVIIHDRRVLLVKRGHPPFAGEWSIPGGALELGETVRDAVIREVREETGITVKPNTLLGVYDRVIRDAASRTVYHYVLIDFLCTASSEEINAASDAEEARWFTMEEVSRMPLATDTAEVIRLGFEKTAL